MSAFIAENRRARFEYHIEETYEAGLVLQGWEVKAIRAGQVQLTDGYVVIKGGELHMIGCRINALRSASTHVNPEADRTKKLLGIATQQAAAVKAGLPAALAAATKDPGGDALVKVALQQWSTGDAKSAVDTAKAALAKPLKDKDAAILTLGLAQIGAGQSADAVKTLNSDKGDGNGPMIAHLYALYAAHPGAGGGDADAAPSKPSKKKK